MNSVEDIDQPPVGKTLFPLVAGVADGVDGTLGQDSAGRERTNEAPCP